MLIDNRKSVRCISRRTKKINLGVKIKLDFRKKKKKIISNHKSQSCVDEIASNETSLLKLEIWKKKNPVARKY